MTSEKTAKLIDLLQQQEANALALLDTCRQMRRMVRIAEFSGLPFKDVSGLVSLRVPGDPGDRGWLGPIHFKGLELVLMLNGDEVARRPLLEAHHELWPEHLWKAYEAKQRAVQRRRDRAQSMQDARTY